MASGSTNKRSGDHQEPAGGAKRPRKGVIDFSVGDSNLTDVVLVVDRQKFHVLKGRLAFHSQPFYTMFYGTYREAEQQEIELTGFGAEEFQVFLEYLYGDCSCRCGEMAQKALVIADMYDVDLVRRRCETTITKSSSLTKKMKFEIAVKYRLENLKGTILGEVKTFDDLEAILPSDLADLDPPTMKVVLEKSLEFNRCSKAPSPVPVPAALPRAAPAPVAAAPVRRAPARSGPAPPVPVPAAPAPVAPVQPAAPVAAAPVRRAPGQAGPASLMDLILADLAQVELLGPLRRPPGRFAPRFAAQRQASPVPEVLDVIDPEEDAAPEGLNRGPRRPRQAQRAQNRAPQ